MTARHPRGPKHSHPDRGAHRATFDAACAAPSKWVRVTCPACGVVRVRASSVVVRNCVDDQSWSYRAVCSQCETMFVATTPSVLALPAVAAGLPIELWSLPTLSGRLEGSPIHAVDALELHLALLEPDWFEQLEAIVPVGDR